MRAGWAVAAVVAATLVLGGGAVDPRAAGDPGVPVRAAAGVALDRADSSGAARRVDRVDRRKSHHKGDRRRKHRRGEVSSGIVEGRTPVRVPDAVGDRSRPNIIFFLADDLDAELLDHMPNTRRFVFDRGAQFDSYFANVSLCCAARASILTGKYAHNTGISINIFPDGFYGFHHGDEAENTFAVWLQERGYRTALLGKYLNEYPYVGSAPGNGVDPGFVPNGWSDWKVPVQGQYHGRNYLLNDNGTLRRQSGPKNYLGDYMARETVRMIEENREDSGLMVMLSSYGPHRPGPASPQERGDAALVRAIERLPLPPDPSIGEADVSDKPSYLARRPELGPEVEAALLSEYRRRVLSVTTLDRHVAEVVAALRRTGQLDNTYLVFSSDNGYHLGHHRLKAGKNSPYDTDVHLPFAIAGPGIAAGTRVDEVTGNIDIAPTFAEMAGIAAPGTVDGESLLPLARGASPARWRGYYLMQKGTVTPYDLPHGEPGTDAEYEDELSIPRFEAVASADHTYVNYLERSAGEELYDRLVDPYQLDNLLAGPLDERPVGAELLRAELAAKLEQLRTCVGAEACRVR